MTTHSAPPDLIAAAGDLFTATAKAAENAPTGSPEQDTYLRMMTEASAILQAADGHLAAY